MEYFNDEFKKTNSSEIKINDGCIKSIFLEHSDIKELDKDLSVMLETGENALIVFKNGKELLITNSEWCSLNFSNIITNNSKNNFNKLMSDK